MKKGILYVFLTAVLFVTLEPVSKLIAGDVNPYAITFWRFIIGSLILLPPAVVKMKKDSIRIGLKDLLSMICLGILFICISMIILQIGVKTADSPSLIAIIFSSNSIFTILFAIFISKEKLNKNKVIALIFGVVGVLACADFSSGTNLTSILYSVLAALSFSLYTVLSQKFVKKFGGLVQTSIVFLTGSLVLLVILLVMGVDLLPTVERSTVAILCYLGFWVTGVGYASYFKAIEKGGAIMASLAFFVKPILTPFVTFLINGIVPDFKVFVAVACIAIACYFATYSKSPDKKLRILFVGNSYTYYNQMPETIFFNVAMKAGYRCEITSVTKGGYRLCQFADPDNEEGKRLRKTIRGAHYDFAVLQEQSLNPIINETQFLEGVKDIASLIDADKFVLYATWGRNDQSENLSELSLTREEMTEKLSIAYNKAANICSAAVAEVGKAFLEYAAEHDKDELYSKDHSHPSEKGSELAAKEILKTILNFQRDNIA